MKNDYPGDNLEALKALLPRCEGKVKCIYIARLSIWATKAGHSIGREGENFSRHVKWFCMLYLTGYRSAQPDDYEPVLETVHVSAAHLGIPAILNFDQGKQFTSDDHKNFLPERLALCALLSSAQSEAKSKKVASTRLPAPQCAFIRRKAAVKTRDLCVGFYTLRRNGVYREAMRVVSTELIR